jgi:DNA-binding response OmpR family regulator
MRQAGLQVPVILASGLLFGAARPDYTKLKITAMIPKPFNLWELVSTVRNILGIKAAAATDTPAVTARALAPRPQTPGQPAKLRHNHVLIADDDAVVRGSLAAVLQSEGYEVAEACNGIEAVTCAIKHKPDLVLLDLNMPQADGWTAFNQLDRVTPLLPVIVITARPNQYPEAVRVGVDAFMEKPLNIPILVSAVKRLTNEDEGRHINRITQRTFVTQLLGKAVS